MTLPGSGTPPLRILLGVLIGLLWIPSAVISFAVIWESYCRDVERAEGASLASVRALGASVDTVFLQLHPALQVLANSPALEQGDYGAFLAQANAFVRQSGLAYNVVVLDREGYQVLNTLRPDDLELPKIGAANHTLLSLFGGKSFAVSDLYQGPVSRRPMIAVAVPKLVGGHVAYVIAAGVEAEHLTELLGVPQFSPDWTVSIVDRSSTIVSRLPDTGGFIGQRVTKAMTEAMATRGREGVFRGKTKEGVAVRAAFSTAPRSGFVIVLGIPEDELLGPARRLFIIVSIALTALLLLALAVAWYLTRRISASMESLAQAALQVGRGHHPGDPPPAFQEAGRVRLALNLAAAELQQAQAELGQMSEELQGKRVAEIGALVEVMHEPVLVLDSDLTIVAANDPAVAMFGHARETLLHMDFFGITAAGVRWKDMLVDDGFVMSGLTASGARMAIHARCRVARIGPDRFIFAWLQPLEEGTPVKSGAA